MSKAEHLALLKQGVNVWNAWRADNPDIRANLFRADLEGMYLAGVNLSKVDLRRARLGKAFLRSADLSEAYLLGADLSGADLKQAMLRKAILREANLSGADLSSADLTATYLSEANLTGASLSDVRLDRTLLTGACIANWHIDNPAQLERVICDYIYLKPNQQECRPRLGSFGPGELVNLCQRTIATLDIEFQDGLDWAACLVALQAMQASSDFSSIRLRSLEQIEEGRLAVGLRLPAFADRDAVRSTFLQEYHRKLEAIEQQYREAGFDDTQIEAFRAASTDLGELCQFLATRQIV
ncbi:MAG: pentapeptide repeat-containing protein [Geitlerinemataceae cyanobacterium]